MTATLAAMNTRIAEIDAAVSGLREEEVQARAPGLWNERVQLASAIARAQAEAEAIEKARRHAEALRNRAEAFPATLEAFREEVAGLGMPALEAARVLSEAVEKIRSIVSDYQRVEAEGQAVGAEVPPLAAAVGLPVETLRRLLHVGAMLRGWGL